MSKLYIKALKTLPRKDMDHRTEASDLYLRVTPESTELLKGHPYQNMITTFTDQIEKRRWYEIPFEFPFKICPLQDGKTCVLHFLKYNENGNLVYDNGIPNVGEMANERKEYEFTVTEFEEMMITGILKKKENNESGKSNGTYQRKSG